MFKERNKNILTFILLILFSIVFISKIILIKIDEKKFNEELKKFYILQNERDKVNRKKEKVYDNFPSKLKKTLLFLTFIIIILAHFRIRYLISLYKGDNEEEEENKAQEEKKENKKTNLFSLIIFSVFVINLFLITNTIGFFNNDDFSEEPDIAKKLRKPISRKIRIQRILNKNNFIKKMLKKDRETKNE